MKTSTKVLLINPPQTELAQPKAYIPLGLAYVAAVLEQSEVEVHVLNLADSPILPHTYPYADWYGVTCVSATYPSALKITRALRESGAKVALGGVHPTIWPEKTFEETGASAVLAGESEYGFRDLVLGKIDKAVVDCGVVEDLDALPLPARHLFSEDEVVDALGVYSHEKGVRASTVISSRGCPFNCSFCVKSHPMFSRFRYRSSENVASELAFLQREYDVEFVKFVDDAFSANRRRVLDLCAMISKMGIRFTCTTRADMVDDKLLREMRSAGCVECCIGVESGSNKLLKLMNKRETVEDYFRAVKKIRQVGINVKVFLMVNFPTETEEDVELTKKFVAEAEPDECTLSNFTLLPGSYMSEHPHEYGVKDSSTSWFHVDEKGNQRYLDFKKWLKDGDWKS